MLNDVLLYVGAGAIFFWGVAHVVVLKPVLSGFGSLEEHNHRIITMEWIAEGLSLCFVGVFAASMTISDIPMAQTKLVYRALAGFLIALAALSAFTGARTAILPMRLCPLVKSGVAALFLLATIV